MKLRVTSFDNIEADERTSLAPGRRPKFANERAIPLGTDGTPVPSQYGDLKR